MREIPTTLHQEVVGLNLVEFYIILLQLTVKNFYRSNNTHTSFSSSQLSQSENSSLSALSSGLGNRVVPRLLSCEVSRATDSCIKRPASKPPNKRKGKNVFQSRD